MVLVYCVKHAFHPDVLSSLLSFISGACSTAKVNTELYFDLDNLVRKDSRSTGGGIPLVSTDLLVVELEK
jgi:hypothetical protein